MSLTIGRPQNVVYELWLNTPDGDRLTQLSNFSSIQWLRSLNAIGAFSVDFPASDFDPLLYKKDRILEIWRIPETSPPQPIMMGFLRKKRRWQIGAGRYIRIGGVDQVDLLKRRIIDADAGSAGASKSGTADDVMKAYVTEALGSTAGVGRDMTANGFSIQGNTGLGPSITKAASRRNLLVVLQELSALAARKGTRVFFDVSAPAPTQFEFRTYKGQRGIDRTAGINPVVFSTDNDSLIDPSLDEDATEEITFAYAGGTGLQTDRAIQTDEDTVRSGAGPFGRREGFINLSSQAPSPTMLLDGAKQAVRDGRPLIMLNARFQSTDELQYGIHFNFGDKVYAAFDEEQFACDIRTVSATFSQGKESLGGELSYVAS